MTKRMVRAIIADDHALLRSGIARLIERDGTVLIVAEASTGREAIECVQSQDAELLILDLTMPDGDGFHVMTHLREAEIPIRILVVSSETDERHVRCAMRAGANGYITKLSGLNEVVQAIHAVARGESVWPGTTTDRNTELEALSRRELQVLILLALGSRNSEIADELSIAIKTVDTHRLKILKKLGLRNNAEMVRFAIRHGVIEA